MRTQEVLQRRIVTTASFLVLLWTAVAGGKSLPDNPIVATESGKVQGTHSADYPGVIFFRGIPYAAPPIGALRWKPPRPAAPWNGVRKAYELSPACSQPDQWFRIRQRVRSTLGGDPSKARPLGKTSEDCLTLNVMTPRTGADKRLPVMVYIHGGGGVIGRGEDDGAELAHYGVVVVTINYRLGVLGWLSLPELTAESPHHSSGNYGLLDQISALRWVHRNISQFGGDPENVTLFGQSSGGEYIGCLMVSPLAHGLFQRAILQSGVPFDIYPAIHHAGGEVEAAENLGEKIAHALGVDDGPDALTKLRKIPAEKLITQQLLHDVVVDGWVIPDQPLASFERGQQADVPVIIGNTEREFGNLINLFPDRSAGAFRAWARSTLPPVADEVFKLYPAPASGDVTPIFIRALTDLEMIAPARWLAETISKQGRRVYCYDVTWVFDTRGGREWGAFHGIDLVLLFDSPRVPAVQAASALGQVMRRYWARFAASGNPNFTGLPKWPAYNSRSGYYLELGPTIRSETHLHDDALKLINNFYKVRLAALSH